MKNLVQTYLRKLENNRLLSQTISLKSPVRSDRVSLGGVLEETLSIPAEKLHDRRIGDLLDGIYPHIDKIWKEIVLSAVTEFGVEIDKVHYDITSIYFEEEYQHANLIEYGYSQDKRPDCKQSLPRSIGVNLRLNVTGGDAIPLAYQVIAGSTADKTTPLENMRALAQLLGKSTDDPATVATTTTTTAADDIISRWSLTNLAYWS